MKRSDEMHIYPKGQHGFALGNKITWFGFEGNLVEGLDWVKDATLWRKR